MIRTTKFFGYFDPLDVHLIIIEFKRSHFASGVICEIKITDPRHDFWKLPDLVGFETTLSNTFGKKASLTNPAIRRVLVRVWVHPFVLLFAGRRQGCD